MDPIQIITIGAYIAGGILLSASIFFTDLRRQHKLLKKEIKRRKQIQEYSDAQNRIISEKGIQIRNLSDTCKNQLKTIQEQKSQIRKLRLHGHKLVFLEDRWAVVKGSPKFMEILEANSLVEIQPIHSVELNKTKPYPFK